MELLLFQLFVSKGWLAHGQMECQNPFGTACRYADTMDETDPLDIYQFGGNLPVLANPAWMLDGVMPISH